MTAAIRSNTVMANPLISFGREICGDLSAGLQREWLVTNGLGGYASGTVAGVATRRYHGLLVAALEPPVGRTVLVGGLVEWVSFEGPGGTITRVPLSTQEYGDGTLDPTGYRYLESFYLEGALPVWTFALGDALLERRLWMDYGSNTTYMTYRLCRGARVVDVELTPLVTYRGFHALARAGDLGALTAEALPRGVVLTAFDGAPSYQIVSDQGSFAPNGDWYWNLRHREEIARGLDGMADLYAPGTFTATLWPETTLTLVLSAERTVDLNSARALTDARARQVHLLHHAQAMDAPAVVQQLTLAADQFIVRRVPPPDPLAGRQPTGRKKAGRSALPHPADGRSIIAGYHWFNDWGRDAVIALPGLTLATGRTEEAATILRTIARYVADGLAPNNFPDTSGAAPGYNTADASLWYVMAVRAYHEATGDARLVDDLLPVLRDIVDSHVRGTRYGIGVDPDDGLLRAGLADGPDGVATQLTWMDAKVGDWVVTPRVGKPVEINALWYNVLCALTAFLSARHDAASGGYDELAERVRVSFLARFTRPGQGHLADVVDGPHGDDLSMRPNQIFAVSLPVPLLEDAEAIAVVDAVGRDLFTTYGLRTLDPGNAAYRGSYDGGQLQRDGAYHQGTAWVWLLGAYVEAYRRVHRDPAGALAILQVFEHHLRDAGLGSVSEIFDGDPPHLPRGCIAQAWSVAEVLRVWRALEPK